MDNIESTSVIVNVADEIYANDVIQGYLNAPEKTGYWEENTEELFSDSYIENAATRIINERFF